MIKKIIILFFLSIRKACGFKSLRRQILQSQQEQMQISKEIHCFIQSFAGENRRSYIEIQNQLLNISNRLNSISENVSIHLKNLDKQASYIQTDLKTGFLNCSNKMSSFSKTLETSGLKKDMVALSGQVQQTKEALDNVLQSIQTLDKTYSLILVNQVMNLAEIVLNNSAKK